MLDVMGGRRASAISEGVYPISYTTTPGRSSSRLRTVGRRRDERVETFQFSGILRRDGDTSEDEDEM